MMTVVSSTKSIALKNISSAHYFDNGVNKLHTQIKKCDFTVKSIHFIQYRKICTTGVYIADQFLF